MKNGKEIALASFEDLCECLRECRGTETVRTEHITAYPFDYDFCWYNRSFIKDASDIPSVLQEIVPGTLVCFDEEEDLELKKALRGKGYIQRVRQSLMAAELKDIETTPDPDVRRIDGTTVRDWAEAVRLGMNKPPEACFFDLIEDRHCEFYGYFRDGKIVGTAMVYEKDGNAGIHEVGVLEEYRRQGIATRLLRHALHPCKERGCRYTSLQASPVGKLMYETLGFREYGGLITMMRLSDLGL